MRKMIRFIKWYIKANNEYTALCMMNGVNPFKH